MKEQDQNAATKNQGSACPEARANCISKLTFDWIRPYMRLARNKRTMALEDLYPVNADYQSRPLTQKFSQKYAATNSFFWSCVHVAKQNFFVSVPLDLMASLLVIGQPLIEEKFNEAQTLVASDPTQPLNTVTLLLGVLILNTVLQNFLFGWSYLTLFRCSAKVRISLMGAIYEKTLRIIPSRLHAYLAGKAVNTMSVDVNSVQDSVVQISTIFVIPLMLGSTIGTLFYKVGLKTSLVALATLLAYVVLQLAVFFLSRNNQRTLVQVSDRRVKLTEELIVGSKVVKLYGLQHDLISRIQKMRGLELSCVRFAAFYSAVAIIINQSYPILATVATLLFYAATQSTTNVSTGINATLILLVLRLMTLVTEDALVYIPEAIPTAVAALTSSKRISDLLNEPEISNMLPPSSGPKPKLDEQKISIVMKNASFGRSNSQKMDGGKLNGNSVERKLAKQLKIPIQYSQSSNDGQFSLSVSNLSIPQGALVAIVGRNGSGKSTLLEAILGSVPNLNEASLGSLVSVRKGEIGYVPQQAWLQSGTVKENILLGKPCDMQRYDQVLKECNLTEDLSLNLSDGDETQVGADGAAISGGQRQRISLARIAYAQPSLVLLDDPLSALDNTVGLNVFSECIKNGSLSRSTRLLVTSRIDSKILSQCDFVIVLERSGSVAAVKYSAPFSELVAIGEATVRQSIATMAQNAANMESITPITSVTKTSSQLSNSFSLTTVTSNEEPVNVSNKKWAFGKTFCQYISYSGGVFMLVPIVLVFVAAQIASQYVNTSQEALSADCSLVDLIPKVLTYGGFALLHGSISLLVGLLYIVFHSRGAKKIHEKALDGMVNAQMKTLQSIPTGSFLSVFSRELSIVDVELPNASVLLLGFLGLFLTTLYFSAKQSWILAVLFIIPISVGVGLNCIFSEGWRQARVLMSDANAKIITNYSETLSGLNVLRPLGETDVLLSRHHHRATQMSQAMDFLHVVRRWMTLHYSHLTIVAELVLRLLGILTRKDLAFFGVYVSGLIRAVKRMELFAKRMSILESSLGSFKLVEAMCHLPAEEDVSSVSTSDALMHEINGKSLTFDKVSFSYDPLAKQPVLRDVSFTVNPGERIAIVGRTGAGKSSLLTCLLRLADFQNGEIRLGTMDIKKMSLKELRSSMAVVSQDPVLFYGTVRYNLDPMAKISDKQIWDALELVSLKEIISALPNKLDTLLTDNGSCLGIGSKQLLCLARALLRNTGLIILDEATASVDPQTEEKIQRAIRTFSEKTGATVLTIAHRLDSIPQNYSKVLVMKEGKVIEYDSPQVLLSNADSQFYKMFY